MERSVLFFWVAFFFSLVVFAQQTIVKGSVKDLVSNQPIPQVTITIEEADLVTTTNASGEFSFTENIPFGEQILKLTKSGYITARFPIVINQGNTIEITDMFLKIDVADTQDLFTVTLSDDELSDDLSGADNISGLLQSSQDVFLRTAAFEFSPSFFSMRGLDSEHGKVLINGIEMNKMFNGRPQWSNWGGMNDVVRNQEFTNGIKPSAYYFGGILGTTNIDVRASHYRRGGRITYSSSNRSYTHRLMASYASGLTKDGWAYALSIGRRWGNQGYQEATLYDANAFFASVEKQLIDNHSLNLTAIFAPNRRGKSSPNTQEVYDLKDIKYNEYWGWQDGEKRNSRIKRVVEPIVMLNHYWRISEKTSLNTNFSFQTGELGNSRLDFNGVDRFEGPDGQVSYEGGGANPSPAYYQKLPSYYLREFPDNPGLAYGAQQSFIKNGQINWEHMYQANISNSAAGRNAIYALYEDRSDDTQITFNSILNTELTDNIQLNASISFQNLTSENFAELIDLLGASGYLDVDGFADPSQAPNDLNNVDRIVGEGDKFKYHYDLLAHTLSGYVQGIFKYNKVDFYLAGSFSNTSYQRDGKFRNGTFPENSFGKGKKLSFTGFGFKGGVNYKITGKHLIDLNVAYVSRAPSLRNTYSNSRENHNVVPNISEEKVFAAEGSYIFRSPIVKGRLTGHFTKIEDANEISFYFADGIGAIVASEESDFNERSNFIQEILQGIDKKHYGVELGIEAQATPTIKLKAAASVGQYIYDNNPDLYVSADEFTNVYLGKSALKNYKLATGPHSAYSVGFEYRDPDYWWVGATVNYFDHTYVDISPLTRTANFYTDVDGQPFNDYDEDIARKLLKQERFNDYFSVNLIGGKSWKIKDYFLGVFISINNLLDEVYRTGGFEQGRNANYRQLREDQALDIPVFGSKYWYGRGVTYFANIYFRF